MVLTDIDHLRLVISHATAPTDEKGYLRLGKIPPRPIVEGVGDRHPSVGAPTGILGLTIGMIAPDEIAPARRKLIECQRRAKAELGRDLGRRIAGTPGRFAQRRLRRRAGRSVSSSVQSKARPNRALPPEPGAAPKATPRTRAPPVKPAPLSSGARSFRPASSRAR